MQFNLIRKQRIICHSKAYYRFLCDLRLTFEIIEKIDLQWQIVTSFVSLLIEKHEKAIVSRSNAAKDRRRGRKHGVKQSNPTNHVI